MLMERFGFSFVGFFLLIHNVLSKSNIPTVYFLDDGHVSIAHSVYRTKTYILTKTLRQMHTRGIHLSMIATKMERTSESFRRCYSSMAPQLAISEPND
jgi:hypothetical protein